MGKPRVLMAALNNLQTDQRVQRTCGWLHENGFPVELTGTNTHGLPPLFFSFETHRLKIPFHQGAALFISYQFFLFFRLFFRVRKKDILWANDVDSVLPLWIIKKIKGCQLILDAHEIYSETPYVQGRWVQKIWRWVERNSIPKVDVFITVGEGCARFFEKKYGRKPWVIKNVPRKNAHHLATKIALPKKFFIYQGYIGAERGLAQVIKAMPKVNGSFVLVGDGPKLKELQELVKALKVEDKVRFVGRVSPEELRSITPKAHFGISLESTQSISFKNALPNKVFDYIQAGIPLLFSDLWEVSELNKQFGFGKTFQAKNSDACAIELNEWLASDLSGYEEGIKRAANVLNWENESRRLKQIFETLIS